MQIHTQAAVTCLAFLNLFPKHDTSLNKSTTDSSRKPCKFEVYVHNIWMMRSNKSDHNRIRDPLDMLFRNFINGSSRHKAPPFWTWMESVRQIQLQIGSLCIPEIEDILVECQSAPPNPVFLACVWGFVEILSFSSNLNTTQTNVKCKSPLFVACSNNQPEVVEILLNDDAVRSDISDSYRWLVLEACHKGFQEVDSILLNAYTGVGSDSIFRTQGVQSS